MNPIRIVLLKLI